VNGVLVEVDLIAEYLTAQAGVTPLLRRLLELVPCYTTFIQAAEIYSTVTSDEERRIVDRALFGLKILGASSRYAKTMGNVLSSVATGDRYRSSIVGAMALESRLPVVTQVFVDSLSQIPGLRVIAAETLREVSDSDALRRRVGNTVEDEA
jgi:hypothetical protein